MSASLVLHQYSRRSTTYQSAKFVVNSPCGASTCVCSGGWIGTRCEVPPDYCMNHDCKHGTCVTGSGTYTCNCTDFFSGSDCLRQYSNTYQTLCALDCTGSNEETQPCNKQVCPVGTYQSLTGQTTCEPCPTGYTTPTFMATGIDECNG
ncbi:hypothetical protein DPMN_149637 [Dreissena polymorpha]|uniref:EGF-like domain-containing protein n=1 Tax=Dreissena polymorpha TaxID=45954 RepID=A0A9D4J1A7_DREPO|nr:hypothetical protein DPMN_149637 [Dreissena polymorpha]